ncbi:MAG: hypothetical protein V3W04_02455 [Gammaproteobacteria bacterium]
MTNTDGGALENIVIRGRQKLPALGSWSTLCSIGSIQPNETGSCTTTSTAVQGTYKVLVTVSGLDSNGDSIELSEQVFYQGQ